MRNLLFIMIALIVFACGGNSGKEAEEKSAETSIPGKTDMPDGVFFKNIEDGATVSSPVKIEMGVRGMEVEPAGMINEGKGHHHVIIDGGFIPTETIVPSDSLNIHFGGGQTETELDLSPGKHTLTLQFANGVHQSYGEEWSKTIEVMVE